MARFLKKSAATIGQSPGALVFIGEQKVEEVTIKVIDYDSQHLTEQDLQDIQVGIPYKDTESVTWLNFNGVHDTDLIRQVGNGFGLHALVMDDIVNTGQRPKMDEYDDYLYFGIKMMRFDEGTEEIKSEQLSMVLGSNILLTFQERPGDVFDPVRDRIRKQKGRIRKVGIDYLAYALLDIIVANYSSIIERLGERIEEIENSILTNPSQDLLAQINNYKREMNYLRKTIRPVREFMQRIVRLDSDLIQLDTLPFLKDLLDLANQSVDVIDVYRDMLSDHLNIYNTSVNNRLNEIMKVLTIFSAIFIPLTFVAGIYGTNFDYLPELHFRYSYFIMWGVFLTASAVMVRFFRKKRWL
ncbi:MAG: magnesium/cobalt transporter CorA [Candidatus Marinimicrobia bacterium]|nr:magnesium/cobalt transporter CorA [Candidatus Neomarinimicrobiota bacterium]